MVEGPKATQITSLEQINQENLQEFLARTSVWDFHEITRDKYMNKIDIEKKDLVINVFNYMSAGNILSFVSLLFGVWFSFVQEHISECSCVWLLSFFSSMISFSPVSSLSVEFYSVSDALPVSELFSDSSSVL